MSSKPNMKTYPSPATVHRAGLTACDRETSAVRAVQGSPFAKPSVLLPSLFPILVHHGVPSGAIIDLVKTQVQGETDEFLCALESPDTFQLRQWMLRRQHGRERDTELLAGFPRRTDEKVIKLLESGFDPKRCLYLANQVTDMARQHHDFQKTNFEVGIPKSSTLLGIADPAGVLEPGEVCVIFGESFTDPATKESRWFIDGSDGLVAGHCAPGAWDVQKVRFVFRKELAYLSNRVIFSKDGTWPLHDGRRLWLTWEPSVVEPFANVPTHRMPTSVEEFGIGGHSSAMSMKRSIIDVVEPILQHAMDKAREIMSGAEPFDPDLGRFWIDTMKEQMAHPGTHQILLALKTELDSLERDWGSTTNSTPDHVEGVQKLRAVYDRIKPSDPKHPVAVEWLRKQGKTGPTTWDRLKASYLAGPQYCHQTDPGNMIFTIAGSELCNLKLDELGEEKRTMIMSQYRAFNFGNGDDAVGESEGKDTGFC